MKQLILPLSLGLVLLAAASASAQTPSSTAVDTPSLINSGAYERLGLIDEQARRSGGLLGSSLFDSDRFSVRNSMSFGYRSGSAGSGSAGLWLSELGYRLARPLYLSVDVGAAIVPGDGALLQGDNVFLHGVSLDYRPSRHFQMSLSYRNLPASAAPAAWMTRYPRDYGARGWWPDAESVAPLPADTSEAP